MSLKLTVSLAAKLSVPSSTSDTVVLLLVAGPIVTGSLGPIETVPPWLTLSPPENKTGTSAAAVTAPPWLTVSPPGKM